MGPILFPVIIRFFAEVLNEACAPLTTVIWAAVTPCGCRKNCKSGISFLDPLT